MKLSYKILAIVFLLMAGLISCYEDLNMVYTHSAEPVVAIEAILTDTYKPFVVLLSKSTAMDDTAEYQEIDSALVFLSNSSDWRIQLKKTATGTYETDSMQAQVGETYKLEVQVDGKWYYAIEKLLPCKIVDSLYVINLTNSIVYEDGLYIMVKLSIPNENVAFYRAVVSNNDSVYNTYNDLLLFETSFVKDETEVLFPYPFISGDSVVIRAYSISERMFEYFNAYARITQGLTTPSSLPMQNPPTNIIGGAVGYFQVSSVTISSIKIH